MWYLSIGTMLLILGGQVYWLYNQYLLNAEMYSRQLFDDCKVLLEKEQNIRSVLSKTKCKKDDYAFLKIFFTIYMNDKDKTNNGSFYIRRNNIKKVVCIKGAHPDDTQVIVNRLLNTRYQKLDAKTLDSLLLAKGYEKASNYRFYTSRKLFVYPVKFNRSRRIICIQYSYNPIECQSVSFDLKVPMSSIISGMAWQLAGSLLLIMILAFCLIYQMRIIFFQKRIDGLRHEFMKNMIYEMKQPPADDNMTEEAIKIGSTEFYYSLNELRNGTERVIITSRQAEILKLLIDTLNEVVYRDEILKRIWGDDSYSNSLALNVQITYLRRALKSDHQISIEAIMKKGYILKVS